ncbi:hypothetical protein ACFL20_06885 [Spirochaetota bacterium]
MTQGLKVTFLLHSICAFLFGIGLYFVPELTAGALNWTPVDPTMSRFMGAAMLAISFKSLLAYRASSWESVRIIVMFEICYCILGATIGLYSVIVAKAPLFAWASIAVWVIFLIPFSYFYRKSSGL